eukprot:CAMPEP_0181465896 /NCGR_PEP_ID=MMETSP1110-20121109/36186_1 /TAXON_ID=174948 /ORGANISM="Symbiodinium sp., Strain CCMP421" /LENGTH=101 /DNA_ID=CAMNT_0023590679 /DNA_START=360 /DNA_END=662 /DNA_ORIENTATION=-
MRRHGFRQKSGCPRLPTEATCTLCVSFLSGEGKGREGSRESESCKLAAHPLELALRASTKADVRAEARSSSVSTSSGSGVLSRSTAGRLADLPADEVCDLM